jgi:hypothetical protein
MDKVMKCLFLSHVEEDQDITLKLAHALVDTGYSVWCYETDSLPAQSYLLSTQQAINQCKAFLLLVSVQSMASHQIDVELERAHELAKPIVPIRFEIQDRDYKIKKPLWEQIVATMSSIPINSESVKTVAARIAEGLKQIGINPDQTPRPPDPPVGPVDGKLEKVTEITITPPPEPPPNPKPTGGVVVVDSSGTRTHLLKYGIIYRPYSSNTLRDAFLEGIIIERGKAGQTVPWNLVKEVSVSDGGFADIRLQDGRTMQAVKLRGGSIVGIDEFGLSTCLSFNDFRSLEVL